MVRLHNKKAKQLNKRVATYTFSYCLALPPAHKKANLPVEIANLPIYVGQKNISVGATLPVPVILLMQLRQCEWKNPKRPKAKYQRMTFHISRYVVNDLKIHLSHGIPQRR